VPRTRCHGLAGNQAPPIPTRERGFDECALVYVLSDGSVGRRSLQLPRGKRLTTICDGELLGSFVKFPWVYAASLAVFSVAMAGSQAVNLY
jgi:hypothetical protein